MVQSKKEMSSGCFTSFMIFFLVVAMLLLYWSYRKYTFTKNVMAQGHRVTGTVIDVNMQERLPGNTRTSGLNKVAPVLEFVFNEDTIKYYSEQYSNVSSYAIGEKVDVYVNADEPLDSIIDSWSEKWGGAFLIGSLGGIFLFLSLGSFFGGWLE